MKKLLHTVGLISLLSNASLALAESPQFQGYFSQGIIYSPDNPFYDDDTGLNTNYRELGLNTSWVLNDQWRFAAQLLSRKAGGLDDGDPRIDFLLADYNFYSTEALSAGVRFGRIKNHYGLYNTTRDVPHGRPGVFVPQSVYFESIRTALLSIDGGGLYFKSSNDFADLSVDLYGGKAHFENDALEYQLFQRNMPGDIEDVDGIGFMTMLEPTAWPGLTLGFSLLDISTEYQDAPSFTSEEVAEALVILSEDRSLFPDYITNMEMEATLTLLSAQYAPGSWIFSAEYLLIDIELSDVELLHIPQPSSVFRSNFEVNGYYLQAEWLASNHLSLYSRYEELYYDRDDKDGEDYAASNGGNPVTQYDKAFTLGARWYFTADFSATAEYSINKGAAFINGQSDVDYAELQEDWDLFIVQFAYHF